MAIMALPVPNKENTFPNGYNNINFIYNEGNSWVPILETSSIKLEITHQSSFPFKQLANGKVFLLNDYEIGKKIITKADYPKSFNWVNNLDIKPLPLGSENYYGNSGVERPFSSYNFIAPDNVTSFGYELSNRPTFSIYSEAGYGCISVEEYNQYCTNKSSTWLNPVMEIAPTIIQSCKLPGIQTYMDDTGSWKILWRSFNIGAGAGKCALMSLVYCASANSYREYYDVFYPYEKLLGIFLDDSPKNNKITLTI